MLMPGLTTPLHCRNSFLTNVKRRINFALKAQHPGHKNQQVHTLFPFVGNPRNDMPEGLLIKLTDYIELVKWSGKQLCFVFSNDECLVRLRCY